MGQEQRRGRTQGELVGVLLPVAAEQKLAIQRGDLRIATKNVLVQRQRKRALIPDLFPHVAQVFIGAVEMNKRQPPGKKKAQDFASLPQAGESP
ncbi:hypothetical protein L1887_45699 [Cichorium endivia]|nr:hypothetical protein L1887_45699 [Cichorium endivia]